MPTDKERLDWMEKTSHIVSFQDGTWWCIDRKTGSYDKEIGEWVEDWCEGPESDTIRGAIDGRMKQVLWDFQKVDLLFERFQGGEL